MGKKKKALNPFADLASPVGTDSRVRPNTLTKEDNGTHPQNRAGRFFAEAPENGGALDW